MNYLKRIEIKKRPQHFQQGGNIAIGSPKPYTTTLPGVNFNPLTLNNAPIEINTTGISDQINKMRQLAFDREALAYKYKELEYKEGKDYLDFYSKILGDLGSTSEKIKSIGGVASLSPLYKPVIDEYNAEMAKLLQDSLRAFEQRDFKTATQITAKRGILAQDPKYNSTLVIAGAYDQFFEDAGKDKYGPFGMGLFQRAYNNITGVTKEDPLKFFAEAAAFKSLGTTTEGLNKSLSRYDKLFEPEEIEVKSGLNNAGQSVITKKKVQRDPEFIARAMMADTKTDPNMVGFLHANNIGASNEAAQYNFFLEYAKTKMKAYEPAVKESNTTTGTPQKDVVKTEVGALRSIPDADKADKMDKTDKDVEIALEALEMDYGPSVRNAKVINAVRNYSDPALRDAAVAKAIKELGLTKIAGATGSKSGAVPGTEDQAGLGPLPNTVKGIHEKFSHKQSDDLTREKVVDGVRYLITADEGLIDKLKGYQKLKPDVLSDKAVREKFMFGDEWFTSTDAINWNTWGGDVDAHVYNLGPATEASTTSAGFDPKNLGEPVATTVAALNLPQKGDIKGEINSHLGEMSRDVINKYQMRVTDTSDSAHDSLAQSTYGTSFDVNFDPSKVKPSETIMNIDKALADFRANGLKAVYEVKTQAEKDAILKANKNLKDSDVFVWAKVSGPHFSVTCENCARLDTIKGQTPTNEVKKPGVDDSGLGKQRLSDWINK
jgi:hypothetical protein